MSTTATDALSDAARSLVNAGPRAGARRDAIRRCRGGRVARERQQVRAGRRMADAAAPFGGYKASGIGREMGHANLDAYLEVKTVWTNLK